MSIKKIRKQLQRHFDFS